MQGCLLFGRLQIKLAENLDLANVWGKKLWIIGILRGRFPGLELAKYCTVSFGPACKLVGESMVKYTEKVV